MYRFNDSRQQNEWTTVIRVVGLGLAAAVLLLAPHKLQAVGLVYVDGDDGINGPANLSPLANINVNSVVGDDGLWSYRSDGGAVGPGGIFRSVYEASGGTSAAVVEDAAQITQTLTGLTANTSYDVYVAYWQGAQAGHDWNIRAGFSPGSLALFNAKGPSELMPDGVAGAVAGHHTWDSAPLSIAGVAMFTEAGRTLLLGKVGTTNSSGSGQIAVTIDDLPANIPGAGTSGHRSWFDGLAYVAAGTDVFVAPGDFNDSGAVTEADASIFRLNLHTDTTGMQITQTYRLGDVTLDGLINHTDFVRFKAIYDAANGEGALASYMASVPEPATWALGMIMLACMSMCGIRVRRKQQRWAFQRAVSMATVRTMGVMAVACSILGAVAQAAPVTGWIGVNAGTGAPTDKTLAGADTNMPVLGDGTNNSAGQVALYADINGTIDGAADVSLANGQSVTFSGSALLEGNASSMENFRFGLFYEAAAPFDAFAWKGYIANNSAGGTGGALRAKDAAFADFNTTTFVQTAAAGQAVNLQTAQSPDAFAPGTYDFSMTVSRFGPDLSIDASLMNEATGFSQVWTGAIVTPASPPDLLTYDFNRVGFLSGNPLSADRISFSNLDVSTAPIEALFLQVTNVGPNAGEMRIVNLTGESFDIDYYEITSAAGSLNPAGWLSLDDQEGGDPETEGWDEAGGVDANILSEVRFEGSTTVIPGAVLNLGNGFSAGGMAQDLVFSVGLPGSENLVRGIVQYGVFLPGDFDGNGSVNGADLEQWRGDFAQNGVSDADNDGDSDGNDFLIWQRNQGPLPPAVAAAGAVPEPATMYLLAAGVLVSVGFFRRWRR